MKDIDGILSAIWNTYEIPNTMYDKHHRVLSYHGQVAIDIENNTLFKRLVEISQSTKKTHIIIDLTSIAVGCIYNELNDDFILLQGERSPALARARPRSPAESFCYYCFLCNLQDLMI